MMLRRLRIEHFRGIESANWAIHQRLISLVGAGDSTKTTLLDAIGLVLSPNYSPQFTDADFGDAFLVDTGGWAVADARDALARGYGVDPVDIGVGGSIPFIADLVREFPSAQILVTGVEDPHSRAHSPNESLHLETFRNAVLSRGLAGVAGRTVVVNLPGSPGGCRDGIAVLRDVLPHAVDQVHGGDHPPASGG